MTMKHKHRNSWTREDVKTLRKLARMKLTNGRRMSARLAASVLGRTPGATKYKAMVLGIRFQNVNQPRGVQKRLARRRRR